jgi:putative MATE family efflux protein
MQRLTNCFTSPWSVSNPFLSRRIRDGYTAISEARVDLSVCHHRRYHDALRSNSDDEDKLTTTTTMFTTHDGNLIQDSDTAIPTGQRILELAIPALGALLIDPLLTLADTAFVGKFSTDPPYELAGMGSATALLTFSFYIFNFLCTATTPLVASKRAAGKESEALAVGGQALSLAFVLGTVLALSLVVFRQPLLNIMGTSVSGPHANEYALDFMTIRAFAAPAVFSISASTGILRGYLDTKTPIVILLVANAVNLALDIALIAGAKMGPTGAAIATTTAEWISAILFLLVLSGKLPSMDGELGKKKVDYDENIGAKSVQLIVTPSMTIPPWEEVEPLIVASSSVFLRSIVLQLFLSAAAAFAARGSASSISAHQIAIQLWILCSYTADALAAASQGLVADAIGREDTKDIHDVSKVVFVYSAILGVLLATLLFVGFSSGFLLDIFTNDAGTRTALINISALIVVAQPLNSLVFAADGVLQGASEFKYQAKSMALSGIIASVGFWVLQWTEQSESLLSNVWLSLIMLQIMRGVTSAVRILDDDGPIKLLKNPF